MREIKFRGKKLFDDELVFGYGVRQWSRLVKIVDNNAVLRTVIEICAENRAVRGGVEWVEILPDTLAQLVGYDKDGKEVYEGDVLYRDFNGVHYEYEVRLFGDAVAENGCYITEKMFREMQVKAA